MPDELSALQAEMALALRHDRALEKEARWSLFAQAQLCGSARLSPVAQLEIYREQFWLRHTGALLEDFPGLAGILGQAAWQRLAQQYLGEAAPASYTLRDLGLKLPETIELTRWLPHQGLCLDMARLEVAYLEVFDATDSEPLAPERLRGFEDSLGECCLVVAPCVRLLSVQYPVAELRRQLLQSGDAAVPMPAHSPQNLLIYRQNLRLWELSVSNVAFELLKGLAAGLSLSDAAEQAASSCEREAELTEGIGDWLREWTSKGLLSDLVAPPSQERT